MTQFYFTGLPRATRFRQVRQVFPSGSAVECARRIAGEGGHPRRPSLRRVATGGAIRPPCAGAAAKLAGRSRAWLRETHGIASVGEVKRKTRERTCRQKYGVNSRSARSFHYSSSSFALSCIALIAEQDSMWETIRPHDVAAAAGIPVGGDFGPKEITSSGGHGEDSAPRHIDWRALRNDTRCCGEKFVSEEAIDPDNWCGGSMRRLRRVGWQTDAGFRAMTPG